MKIRVYGLNGESLEVDPKEEAKKLCYGDVKRILAAKHQTQNASRTLGKDASKPFQCSWIRLVHARDAIQIADKDEVNWKLLEEGSLHYVVSDVKHLDLKQFPTSGDDLLFGCQDPGRLLDPVLLMDHARDLWKHKGEVICERIFDRWALAVRSLPSEVVNEQENPIFRKSLILDRCFALFQALSEPEDLFGRTPHVEDWQRDASLEDFLHRRFAKVTMELLKLMDAGIFQAHFHHIPPEQLRSHVWKLVQGHPCVCNRPWCFHGALRMGFGAELVMQLIDKGLPELVWRGQWGPNNETLLQYVVAAVAADWRPQEEAKARLCKFLAEAYTLEQLCHQDRHGKTAFWYATHHCQPCPDDVQWTEVRDVMSQQMQAKLRDFEGSLLKMTDLARSVRVSFHGASNDVASAFDEQMWHRAAKIRNRWFEDGWRFQHDRANDQISEVLDWHYKAVGQGIIE